MKTESDIKQPKYILEPIDYGIVRVTLYANETQVERDGVMRYLYDKYAVDVPDRPSLGQYISGNLDAWIASCDEAEAAEIATEARNARDKLLAETDYLMAIDRIDLTIPAITANTATQACTALKALCSSLQTACSGDWAKYRQELRDIPSQAGFPRDIVWPKKPGGENA